MTYACLGWEIAAENHLLKLQRLQNKDLRNTGNFPRCKPVRDLHGFQTSVYIQLHNKIIQATSGSRSKLRKCKCSQHWTRRTETQEILCKRLKLGGSQA
jgi:hypothetical protein